MSDLSIDLSIIQFPSDRLTVAVLRRACPHSFDLPDDSKGPTPDSSRAYGRASLERAIGAVIDRERVLATVAFKSALGYPLGADENLEPRPDLVEGLTEDYVRLGLASGRHHAEQLVRDVEAQAGAQAARYRPR